MHLDLYQIFFFFFVIWQAISIIKQPLDVSKLQLILLSIFFGKIEVLSLKPDLNIQHLRTSPVG